jgi:aromatic-L-amino-acid decarboxylase
MTPEEFRVAGHRIIDWVADYRARAATLPVMPPVEPGDLKNKLPQNPPDAPESFDRIVRDLDDLILPALLQWQHPEFFGYFPSNASLSSVLGDYVSTGLGVIGLAWQSSPALTELEEVTTNWMREMLGLSDNWSGVIQDTASTSTLIALLCARERTTSYGLSRGGLQAETRPLVVYVSAQSHSSVDKAALLAGFGRENVHVVAHDSAYAMRPDALDAAIDADLGRGAVPCAVVATVGTTASTALDPIEAIARISRQRDMWLHVDAAMAGSAMILPECRSMWHGIEGADSVVVNAHKWLGAVFDCSLYYVRDAQHLVRVMSTNPSYLRTAADGQVKNFRDWGLPLGRRFRALKLWFLIREQGVSALQARLRRDLANAQWLAEQVRQAPDWQLLAPVPLQTLCVRHHPTDGHRTSRRAPGELGREIEAEALDRHTLAWVERVNRSGVAYLTPALLDGRWMARVSIGAEPTERAHVERLWETMKREAANC